MIDKILKDIKGLFKVQDKVKFLKQNIPYLAFFYIGNIFSHHVRAYIVGDIIDKIFQYSYEWTPSFPFSFLILKEHA